MKPEYSTDGATIYHGDCLDVLRELPDNSVDAVVTDPPYGLGNTTPEQVAETIRRWMNGERDYLPGGAGFMGKAWDAFVPPVAVWDEALRVLTPGGHLLSFAGDRTYDLMTLGIRLGGFEIRQGIAWMYGSGFPKSHDVSKAIDKHLGAERAKVRVDASEVRNPKATGGGRDGTEGATRPWIEAALANGFHEKDSDEPATEQAAAWEGWGTALKPAFEPVVVARKPLVGTVAANVLEHGTGGLNIDACRIAGTESTRRSNTAEMGYHGGNLSDAYETGSDAGRWPANVILDEHQAAELDQQAPDTGGSGKASGPSLRGATAASAAFGARNGWDGDPAFYGDTGGASRFFYVAKADSSERVRVDGIAHPTVKPLDLIRWLVRLVTPPGGTVLDMFAGSGTTGEACLLEGYPFVLIERESEYHPLIRQRIARRRDPVAAVLAEGGDGGLFDLLTEGEPA